MSKSGSQGRNIVFSDNLPPSSDSVHAQIVAMGKTLSHEQFENAYHKVCKLYELKNKVYPQEVEAIVDEILIWPKGGWQLVSIKTTLGSNVVPAASIVLKDPNGKSVVAEAVGDSSTDAIYSAIQKATNTRVFLRDFTYGTISAGVNAMGKATVKVECHGSEVKAEAYSVDILEAAAKAYLIAINLVAEKVKQQY